MGSGSTGVACVNTERKFIGFELDSHFYEIAQERIMTTKNRKECGAPAGQRYIGSFREDEKEEFIRTVQICGYGTKTGAKSM